MRWTSWSRLESVTDTTVRSGASTAERPDEAARYASIMT
jgi:hypothetical protein